MKVITTIIITEEVPEAFNEQCKRNFDRTPTFGGDEHLKDHIKKLIPVLDDRNIEIQYRLEESE